MNSKLAQFLKQNIFPILLVLFAFVLVIQNYTPKTYLSGWDTLHPEFNYRIYWARIIDGVWQEHQGLGAVGSQAHPSEIPRVLTIMLMDLVLPTSMVRYAYAFLMLILGPLGMYFFMKKGVFAQNESSLKTEVASFLAGLFYLLNLVTLQHFYVPLEMFLTHYGYLGFFMLTLVNSLNDSSRKNLLKFVLISFLMAPQAHTSTLYFALIIFASAYVFLYWALNRFSSKIFKNALKLVFLLFAINAFWLLPNFYFIKNHGAEVQESKIQRLFNEEAFLQNNSFGNIQSIALGKGFLFNWGEHDGNLGYRTLLDEWRLYQRSDFVMIIGVVLFTSVLLGIAVSIKYKNKESIAILGILFVSLFFLFGTNPPSGFIYNFISEHSELFKDAFRFNFTKFSISLVFAYSVFFGMFAFFWQDLVTRFVHNQRIQKILQVGGLFLSSFLLVIWMWPAFKGYLVSPSMRVHIPSEYFDMFEFFDEQKGFGRVADLPINSFWGWVYYDWPEQKYSYQGAGFLWFGIKQPLMNREFDRWNPINQNYYKEMSRAVYSRDIRAVEQVMEKYKIRYVLHDNSVVAPGHNQKVLFVEEIPKLLSSSENFQIAATFGSGLTVYEYLPGRNFQLNEQKTASDVTLDVFNNIQNVLELPTEELDSQLVTSDSNTLQLKLPSGNQFELNSKTRIPFDVSYTLEGSNLNLDFSSQFEFRNQPLVFTESIEAPIKVNGKILFSIDGDFYEIDETKPNGELGKVFLPAFESVKIAFYNGEAFILGLQQPTIVLETCSKSDEFASFEYVKSSDGIELTGKNVDACISTKLSSVIESKVPDNTDALRVMFDGNYTDIPCIYNTAIGICENTPLNDRVSYVINKNNYMDYVLRFFARGHGSSDAVTSKFRGIEITPLASYQSSELYIPAEIIGSIENLEFDNSFTYSKDLALGGDITKLRTYTRYCKSEERYDGMGITDIGLKYVTEDKEICTSVEFPYASHKTGYILEVRSKHTSGLPLRFCLTNEYSKRCDKYIELSKSRDPITQYYIVPPFGNSHGYTFNISALSFGGNKTENDLYYAALTPIPYDLLYSSTSRLQHAVGVVHIYNQAYEPGWILLCGLSKCDATHMIVNGWANGWVFGSSSFSSVSSVRVLFLPQALEYFGMLLGLVVAGWLLIRK